MSSAKILPGKQPPNQTAKAPNKWYEKKFLQLLGECENPFAVFRDCICLPCAIQNIYYSRQASGGFCDDTLSYGWQCCVYSICENGAPVAAYTRLVEDFEGPENNNCENNCKACCCGPCALSVVRKNNNQGGEENEENEGGEENEENEGTVSKLLRGPMLKEGMRSSVMTKEPGLIF